MSVIKTLDASENNDEREKEKLKIEKEFKKSDKRLQELVTQHDTELTKVRKNSSKKITLKHYFLVKNRFS